MRQKRFLRTTVAVIAILALGAQSALSQTVGTAGAVNPASTGTPPGGSTRTIELGSDVVFQERIQTTASGSVQVLFVDRTALTVGPNSNITIDEFVFDPNAGTGSFVATLAEGSLRFIGGQISRNSGVTINTPTATIGIRGSAVGIAVTPNAVDFGGGLTVSNYHGNVRVDLQGGQSYTLEPGFALVVDSETQAASVAPVSSGTAGPTTDTGGSGTESGTGEGNAETTVVESENAGPPVFVPDPVNDVYFQDPAPESPSEPPVDPPPPPPPPDF